MKPKKCLYCGKPVTGRRDKKYCSDVCRYEANNENKISRDQFITATNRALRANRTILMKLCPHGKATVRRSVLEQFGYSFDHFTGIFVTRKREAYYLCYDYGFLPILEKGIEKALIIGRQKFMNHWDPWKRIASEGKT